jgi:hypothetical protein
MFVSQTTLAIIANLSFTGFMVLGSLPLSPRPGEMGKCFGQIKQGATFAGVEKAFGEPAHLTNPVGGGVERRQWSDNDGCATVIFLNGRVSEKTWRVTPIWEKVHYRFVFQKWD